MNINYTAKTRVAEQGSNCIRERFNEAGSTSAPERVREIPVLLDQRVREIPVLLDQLHATVQAASEAFARVQDRLQGALPPMPPYDKIESRIASTGLGASLAELLSRVELLDIAINRVHDALEI